MAYWKEPKKRANYTPHEEEEQKALIQWTYMMANKYQGLDLIFAIPNGGSRNQIEARNLKLTGVKAGVPDLFLPVSRKGKHGLFIEMKRKEGGRLSDYQKEWIQRLTEQGYQTAVCKGFEEAINVIETYYGDDNDAD